MPAYSFKERFVPMILDGTKTQTIRKIRQKGFAKVGDPIYLYFGMRTKFCQKLGEGICTDTRTIRISEMGITIFNKRMHMGEFEEWAAGYVMPEISFKVLAYEERELFAWKDGFKPDGSTLKVGGGFELMMRFWKQTNNLPFIGDIIYWKNNFSQ